MSDKPIIDRGDAVNLVHSIKSPEGCTVTAKGITTLADAVLRMDEGIRELERALTAEAAHKATILDRHRAIVAGQDERYDDLLAQSKAALRALSAAEQRSVTAATVAEGMARDAKRIHAALTVADECGLITDTLWMPEGNETVFDAVAALASGEPK